MTTRPGGLGRGLGALIPRAEREPAAAESGGHTKMVPLGAIRSGRWQPRREFSPAQMDELAASIRAHGVLQPLLVRPAGEGYELIAGERRYRAAVAAGLSEVPVRVMEVSDVEALELALIENLQREDLDPIEEAEGYRALGERFQLTQEQIAVRVGRSRAAVANALRLLTLPEGVREMLRSGALSVGHAKVLLGLPIAAEQEQLAGECVRRGWSVRELEREVARRQRGPRRRRAASPDVPEVHLRDVEERLKQKLGSPVRITPSRTLAGGRKAPGRIEGEFYSADDLDRLMLILGLSEDF
ncbi:MAG: ParB/RepB/Spo0J family partition protein [Kiritimatiellae bacterium]|nr:ParB/RepB/Spo0J family partition protein [Kiritimatiellia bacterium]